MLKVFIENNELDANFARDGFRRYVMIAFAMLVLNFLLVAVLFYNQLTVVQAPTFATTSDGRIIQLTDD